MFGNKEKEGGMTPPSNINTKTSSNAPTRNANTSDTITAYLGPDTSVEGTLRFEHSVLIEGKFNGQIESKGSLVIGEGAEVDADIKSANVSIKGTVKGSIEASERVQIQHNGTVIGDITTPSLQMDESVTFEGRCSMGKNNARNNERKENRDNKRAEEKILDAVETATI